MGLTIEWIQGGILARGALAGLNDQARGITLALVETGCRPREICDVGPGSIILDGEIPYVRVCGKAHVHESRSDPADRKIPLVGVALEVFKRHPDGFPRYRGKSIAYSARGNTPSSQAMTATARAALSHCA